MSVVFSAMNKTILTHDDRMDHRRLLCINQGNKENEQGHFCSCKTVRLLLHGGGNSGNQIFNQPGHHILFCFLRRKGIKYGVEKQIMREEIWVNCIKKRTM